MTMEPARQSSGIPEVMCWVCQRPVTRIVVERDFCRQQTTVQVWCHGQKDTAWIDDKNLMELQEDEIRAGMRWAFKPKLLEVTNP